MMSGTSSQIRSTKNYLWYLSDVLGTGATSTVYKGRHKKTGELVAAKAFNSLSYMRPHSVQQREFDVLLKLHHRNIVKLHDIETDQISKNPVIIMELCSGGSLYNLLEDPKNAYGIEEEEFKRVLGDVCAGMKHLRDLDIVHRDIKPGNIMIVTADDGSSIYKLADFGAARELQDDENFMSLYGTEEYLHPDLYERAVLRQPTRKAFSARIDLWSIGITFYHVATGVLPFRPFGGRKNRETMFNITTRKASGVISGVQKDSMVGPIEWSSELPTSCRYSRGLKCLLTKILQGLLECNTQKMWTFNQFFEEVQFLLAMKVLDVFHVSQSECLKVYVEPSGTLAEFQECIAEQTGMQAARQLLIWDKDTFCPDISQKCESYPKTSSLNPVILLEKGINSFPHVSAPYQAKMPKMSSTYDLDKDASISKMAVAALYFTLAWLRTITCMQELMTTVSTSIVSILKTQIKQLDYHCLELKAHSIEVDTRLDGITRSLPSPAVLFAMTTKTSSSHSSLLYTQVKNMQAQVTTTRKKAVRVADSYNSTAKHLKQLVRLLVEEDRLIMEWAPSQQALEPCHLCFRRFEFFTEEARKIHIQFKKEKQKKQLTYNEEQIHKMDKEKLNTKSGQAMSICQSHCEIKWKDIHRALGNWYKTAYGYWAQINTIDGELFRLFQDYQTLLQEVHMLDQQVQPVLITVDEILQDSLLDPGTIKPSPSKGDVATSTDSLTPFNVLSDDSSSVSDAEVVTPEDIASFSAQLEQLPVDSSGCVLIPRPIKELFESYEKSIDHVTEQLERGQRQMELMQMISLSAPPPEGTSQFSNGLPDSLFNYETLPVARFLQTPTMNEHSSREGAAGDSRDL